MKETAKIFYFTSFMVLSGLANKMKSTQNLLQSYTIFEKERNLKNYFENAKSDKKDMIINKDLKYVLVTAKSRITPLAYMGEGQKAFIDGQCKYSNCFVTFDRNLLGDITKFDVIVFSGSEIINWPISDIIPKRRSPHQKYVFATIESADNFPVCSDKLDNFFNWTWTYRLDSEAQWGYIIVRDANGNVIGPRKDMHWMKSEDMTPVSNEFKMHLRNKTRAAAWFVSNCYTISAREHFVKDLQEALKTYNLEIDVYGSCGPYQCERDHKVICAQLIKNYYYFYLAFENSFSEYYVTEKVLLALQYNAVPIVYGGANYTRLFMPPGIYLNARELGPTKLAEKMRVLIDHPNQYIEYFRWKNHYSFHARNENSSTNDFCGFCKLINNENMVEKTSIYKNFKEWWSEPKRCLYFGKHFFYQ